MNAEKGYMRGKQRQTIQQMTMMLPYFDEKVPLLYPSSILYVPIIALCGMWTVCYSTRDTETPLHLLPGGFL
jgi:hypothetical protein